MPVPNRAVVTGVGVVSPIGIGGREYLESLLEGRSGLSDVTAFDTRACQCHVAGQVPDRALYSRLDDESRQRYDDRYLHMAIVAAREAFESAGLEPDCGWSRSAAVCVGTCNGGLKTAEKLYRMLYEGEAGILDEKMNLLFRYFALPRALAIDLKMGGPNLVVTTACSSSTCAFGLALDLVASGRADIVLAGGSDALCYTTFAGFSGIGAMARGLCAPFSGEVGLNLGEGAAFWVVEERERALSRGAAVIGEILGYGLTADAYHPTAPEPRGVHAARAMEQALKQAGLNPDEEPGYINAHGTGTEANDSAEARALRKVLKDRMGSVPVSSTKSMIGHCLGAAGSLEATASLLCMKEGYVPPTLRAVEPRAGAKGIDLVPYRARRHQYSTFLSNSFAFGGNNAVIAVGSGSLEHHAPAIERRGVAVTGMGAVTPFGPGLKSLVNGIRQGSCAVRRVERFDTSGIECNLAGTVPELDLRTLAPRLDMRGFRDISVYATLSCMDALVTSGRKPSPRTCREIGMVLGMLVGPGEESLMQSVWKPDSAGLDVAGFSSIVANSVVGEVSRALYLNGYNTVISCGHQSGVGAVLAAAEAVALGRTDVVLAGGADELFYRYMANYQEVGYLPGNGWESGGPGMDGVLKGKARLLAEGAVSFMLEPLELEGANPKAVIEGWAHTFDQGDFVAGRATIEGLVQAVARALDAAGIGSMDVDVVIWAPQGNETDLVQEAALSDTLGEKCVFVDCIRNTGYSESSSALWALAAWMERPACFGDAAAHSDIALVVGSSYYGNNMVLVVRRLH